FGLSAVILGVAVVTAKAIGISGGVDTPRTWGAITVGVLSADFTGALFVLLAIYVTERTVTRRRLLMSVVPGLSIAVVNTTLALVGALVVSVNAWALFLLVVVVVVFLYAYRAYGRFLAQHERLGRVYEFSKIVEASRNESFPVADLLNYFRETLNAERITIFVDVPVPGTDGVSFPGRSAGRTVAAVTVRSDGSSSPWWQEQLAADPLRAAVIAEGRARLVRQDEDTDARWTDCLVERAAEEAIVAPLHAGDMPTGIVEVYDRQSRFSAFTADDVALVENLASHLAAAVNNYRLVQRLRHEAYHDQLTGLPNRTQFMTAAEEAIEAANTDLTDASAGVVGVVVIGLDSLKEVNDSLGHDAGDQLVIAVAERLREQVSGDAEAIARVGGDIYAVLVRADDLATVTDKARAWHSRLCAPCVAADVTIEVGMSIGIAVWPTHAADGATLLQRADVAIDAARSSTQPVATYLPSMDHSSLFRLQLATDLRSALAGDQLTVRYQPKVALAGRELAGVEALVRWEHPEFGDIPPEDFIPLAERTGLIGMLTSHVLHVTASQCRQWLDRGQRIGVAVNISVRSLLDANFPENVMRTVEEAGIPPELLTLEITENNVMTDPDRALPLLHRLHELGVGLAIDDFGTGYSSLAYLRRLPVDEVKIDKGFVMGMATDLGDLAIVRTIVKLCHSLGLRVVAEGVEEELGRDLLDGMGCDIIQGYLVSRPLAVDRLDAWLAARTVARPPQPGMRGRRLQLTL
ncbi:MAG TPA: GGDEF domain-containing protein, partial [Mycobacteriales bacterium]|nr:GGDEF domain-containing protein [Mycobacteriales bacterium]